MYFIHLKNLPLPAYYCIHGTVHIKQIIYKIRFLSNLADELFFKAEPAKCGAGEWLQDLWAIVRYNDLVAMDLDMTRTCKFMDDQINYITKPDKNLNDEPLKKMVKTNKGVSQKAINHLIQLNQILNDETIRDLRQIVSFGKQFNLPLAKSVFNVYGSQTDSPRVGSDRDTSYYGILHKYENRLKSLDGNQQKKLNSLVKSTKPKIATIYNKIHDISLNSNDNLKKFHTVTFEIFLAMKQMAEEKNVAESVKTIHESIAVCKKYMRLPYLKKTIDTNIDNLKPLMDELVAAQKNLSHDIEEILKVEPKKSALSYLRLKK